MCVLYLTLPLRYAYTCPSEFLPCLLEEEPESGFFVISSLKNGYTIAISTLKVGGIKGCYFFLGCRYVFGIEIVKNGENGLNPGL